MKIIKRLSQAVAHWRIGTKLTAAFAAVLVLTMASGLFGIVGLSRVNVASDDLANRYLPLLGHATALRAAALDYRDQEMKHARAADASYMAEYEDKMAAAREVVNKNQSEIERLAAGEAQRESTAAFVKAWAEYQKVSQRVVALSRETSPTMRVTSAMAPPRCRSMRPSWRSTI